MTTRPTTPIKLFYSCTYERKDERLRNELEKHLSSLRDQGYISDWQKSKVMAGKDFSKEVDEHLNTAHIILLLVSPDFMASNYCIDVEVKRAMERHDAGEAQVIPIILRPVDWHDAPFGKLQALPSNGKPVSSWHNTDEALFKIASEIHRVIDEFLGKNDTFVKNKQTFDGSVHEKEGELQAPDSINNDFIHNLLEKFTGRQQELTEIRQRIAEIQPVGGYIAITGAAGQGKSSIIAKLVEEYESQNVASNFILFNPGSDYQITLLKHLMAHLIRKYQFSDLYLATESLPALHDYFSIVLRKIAERGGDEVIFIDGLEQLEKVQAEMHDFSFLPHKPPPGIIFVLGIRTENTLKSFEISKSHYEYSLTKLNRSDFESILQHHHIQLEREQVNQLYHATQGNALYLDLTIEELKTQGIAAVEEIIALLTNQLENLFALPITRLEHPHREWNEELKPVLGVFMVARESLSIQSICQILDIKEDYLKNCLTRLNRLVAKNSQNRYALFHSDIYKYLHQDSRFSALEWHKKFVRWCEKSSIATIWEDSNDLIEQQRRVYARHHYITHLYYTRDQRSLFQVLDEGQYGQAKIHHLDPGIILYARDLDRGKQASVWKGRTREEQGGTLRDQILLLPLLWRYSLLRCSLTDRESQYPVGAFRLLVLLKRDKEALQLAESLTNPISKAKAFLAIAKQMQEQPEHGSEYLNILIRVYTVVDAIKENMYQRSAILLELGQILTLAQEWDRAKSVWDVKSPWDKVEQAIDSIKEHEQHDKALWELGRTMTQTEQWLRAEQVINKIQDHKQQAQALLELGRVLARTQRREQTRIWEKAKSVIAYIQDSEQQTKALSELGRAFTQSGQWDEAEKVIDTIQDNKQQTEALRDLGRALAQAELWERAETVWGKVKQTTETPRHIAQRVMVLSELGRALTQAQQKERAEAVWDEAERLVETLQGIEQAEQYVEALLELGKALTQTYWMKTGQIKDTTQDSEQYMRSLARQQMQGHVKREIVQAVDERIEQEEERSKAVWTRAEQAIRAIQANEQFNEASWELGSILIHAQQWGRANRVVANIKDDVQKTEALLKLAQALTREQLWEQSKAVLLIAEQMMEAIQNSEQRNTVLNELAWALMQAHLLGDAERVIKTIQNNEQQAELLYELSRKLMQIQNWIEAERVIGTIQGSKQQTEALRDLGRALAQAELWERAETVWGKVKQTTETPRHIAQRVMVLSELGRALTQAQQKERAEAVWDEAERLVETLQGIEQYEALLELSKALVQTRRWKQADKMMYMIPKQQTEAVLELGRTLIQARQWDQAQSIIDDLEGSEQYAEAILEMVRALVGARRWSEAEWAAKKIDFKKDKEQYSEAVRVLWKALIQERRWDKAEQVIDTIQSSEKRIEALCQLGEALAKAKRQKQAETIWTKLERAMNTIQDNEQKDEILCILVQTLSQAKEWDKARQVINSIQDRDLKDIALGKLEVMLIQTQEWKTAKQLISAIQDIERKIEALCVLGQALTQAVQREQAQKIWEEIEQILSKITDFNQRNSAARESAHVLTLTQQWDRAERVAGIIGDRQQWIEALIELVRSLAQAQLGERAKQLINTIQDNECHATALRELEEVENGEQVRLFREEAEEPMDTNQDHGKQIRVLSELKPTNIRAQQRKPAEDLIGRRQRDRQKNTALGELARALQAQRWEQAEQVIESISDDRQKNTALGELARAVAQAQQWEQAEQVISRIPDNKQRNAALNELGTTLAATNRNEELLNLVQRSWLQIETREDAIALLPLAVGFISFEAAIGTAFCKAFDWVDDFLVGR